ncbi:MAG: tyrosine-type recombinase/integrase [Bryobacterales bacterium]|nr:tyrosine-type recombinase/integrase [Bryobacterales bacterium]
MTVRQACEAYLRELEARNVRKSTREGYQSVFRQLQAFAAESGLDSIEQVDLQALRAWRERWTWAHSTQAKVLAQLKAFFAFAASEGWVAESPVNGIRRPQSDARPTLPLSADEVLALLRAAEPKPKEQALLLLLRYSGLAIRDAATLRRDAVQPDGDLVLRRAKSGELVTVALPAQATAALESVVEPGRAHYFWTGRSEPRTAANYWRERLKQVAAAAGIDGFHPHRLRDTFAVELLLAGVMIQDVSSLLGHSSVATTERYYAPWNLARSKRLGRIVRRVHQRDPILLEFTPKKPAGSVTALPAEAGLATSPRSQAARLRYA